MYAYLYAQQNNQSNTQLHSGIISFRTLSSGFMPFVMNKGKEINQKILSDFETLLKEIFTEMLNPEIPFIHQSNAKYCEFCD